MSNMALRDSVNHWVASNGTMLPVRLFRHGLKVVYSKTMCGVVGAAQLRAGLRLPSSQFNLESKVDT